MLRIGSKVVFLSEKGGGTIVGISPKGKLLILDENDGFEREYLSSQITVVAGDEYCISDEDVKDISSKDEDRINQRLIKERKKPIDNCPMIDLHIEELTESSIGLTNFEILSRQMIAFRQFYNRSRNQKKSKIIVIHGTGEGVLRSEIRLFLNGEEGVEYYDSSYTDFGQGATTIELRYWY